MPMLNPDDTLPEQVLSAIATVTGESGSVALHEPNFEGNEWLYLKECLDSSYVSSVGKFVDRFEHDLAAFAGVKHAVAVVSGTAALHIALKLAGVQESDEVIIPSLTFVATANAVVYCGAVPHFADSEERTLGLAPRPLREYLADISEQCGGVCVNKNTGRPIRALVPMHTFGHPVDLDGLMAVAHDYNLALIEDAAESLGSYYYGRHTGSLGLMGTLSFNGNKTITTGGGGAILTNDTALAQHAKHLSTTAKKPHRWVFEHDEVGYNYRMPNINAALGCAQLEQLPNFLLAKRRLFEQYQSAFIDVPNISLMAEPEGCTSNYWLQALVLDVSAADQRDAILVGTNDVGLMTRPTWSLMTNQRPYLNNPRAPLPVAEMLEGCVINIPSSACLASNP